MATCSLVTSTSSFRCPFGMLMWPGTGSVYSSGQLKKRFEASGIGSFANKATPYPVSPRTHLPVRHRIDADLHRLCSTVTTTTVAEPCSR
ncbi:unnamed protein product [Protopolystoma xenopodis]|uniref:Uncharacterized protein n=1 Tax=Protopolystoma xenopodis TaxID=117903 RepID=A0A3S5C3D9_9PLAT|nr:unnamed protein product [Protopolystoma xenopodis]